MIPVYEQCHLLCLQGHIGGLRDTVSDYCKHFSLLSPSSVNGKIDISCVDDTWDQQQDPAQLG